MPPRESKKQKKNRLLFSPLSAQNPDRLPSERWGRRIAFVGLLVDLYVIATFFTPWTGSWGKQIALTLLKTTGGSTLVLLLFLGYLFWGQLSGHKVPCIAWQTLGTLFLFFCTALLLGLIKISHALVLPTCLSPGRLGERIARFCLINLGPLGTVLLGFLGTLSVITLYGFDFMRFRERWGRASVFFTRGIEKTRSLFQFLPKAGKEVPSDFKDSFPESEIPQDSLKLDEPPKPGSLSSLSLKSWENEADNVTAAVGDFSDSSLSLYSNAKEKEPAGIQPGMFPPPIELLGDPPASDNGIDNEHLEMLGMKIISSLEEFGIEAELAETLVGPTVIQFRIQLAPGIKVSRVASLSNDLTLALAVPSLRVEAPIPGKPFVGIEIPNPKRRAVPLRTVIESEAFQQCDYELPLPMGVSVDGEPFVTGLEDLPHLLVAGTTGSGKSVFVNACIMGLCFARRPDELRLLLVDPKRVEMTLYERLPHIITPPVVDTKKAVHALAWALREMQHRYDLFAKARVRNLETYNSKTLPKDRLPHIVIVVDELADLMMTSPKEVEDAICRLAQMARATGIHLILATQRPSVNVITGLIKANIPARVAFALPSQADSRTILDHGGADRLLGKGDMLFLCSRYPKPFRLQAPWVDEKTISRFIDYLLTLFDEPQLIEIEDQGNGDEVGMGTDSTTWNDPLLEEAVHIVLNTGIASASRLQRQLRIGFTRAARLIDMMEQLGIVGAPDGSKPREILVDEASAEEILERFEEEANS